MDCATVHLGLDEECTLLSKDNRKARKLHKCGECNRIIQPGENYVCEVTLFDGVIERNKTCLDCKSLRDNFFQSGWYWGGVREDLYEHIRECHGDISETTVSELTPRAREFVCKVIEKTWEDDDDAI